MSRAVIKEMADLIGAPERWCQGHLALSKAGYPCEPVRGKRWDALGAAYKVTHTRLSDQRPPGRCDPVGAAVAALNLAAYQMHRMGIQRVNDELGHAAVMDVLRKAWRLSYDEETDQ